MQFKPAQQIKNKFESRLCLSLSRYLSVSHGNVHLLESKGALQQMNGYISAKTAGKPYQVIEVGSKSTNNLSLVHEEKFVYGNTGINTDHHLPAMRDQLLCKPMHSQKVYNLHGYPKSLRREELCLPGVINVFILPGATEEKGFSKGQDNALRDVSRPGDLMLSERVFYGADRIFELNPFRADEMKMLSKFLFRRAYPGVNSQFGIYLFPVPLNIRQKTMVVVTAETVAESWENDSKQIFITNYCLKDANDYFQTQEGGEKNFKVIAQRITGDDPRVLQISERI